MIFGAEHGKKDTDQEVLWIQANKLFAADFNRHLKDLIL